MKSFLAFLLLLASLNVFATETKNQVVVACSDDNKTYNVKFNYERNKMVSYAINDVEWTEAILVTPEEIASKQVWVEYAMEYDTSFGYVVYLGNDLLKDWKIDGWTAGNDSDNYEPSVNDYTITCHMLLKDPKKTEIDNNNIFKKL
jgi:hypothetical protein